MQPNKEVPISKETSIPVKPAEKTKPSPMTLQDADKDVKAAIITGWIIGGANMFFSIILIPGGGNTDMFFSGAVTCLLTVGLYFKNRFSAWAILIFFVIQKFFQLFISPSIFNWALVISIGYFLVKGIKGMTAWHKLASEGEKAKIFKLKEVWQTLLIIAGIIAIYFVQLIVLIVLEFIKG